MVFKAPVAKLVAEKLLEIEAVRLSPDKPFTWASGWKSPIYCDNRKTLAYPTIRKLLRTYFVELIQEKFPNVQAIAGVATAGIPVGMMVAEALNLPFAYVRSKPKDHGLGNQIEGIVKERQRVVVVEDLVSTGKSSLHAVEALREAGAEVLGLCAIFTYGFREAEDAFKMAKCPYWTLSDFEQLRRAVRINKQITQEESEMLKEWRKNPAQWGQ